MKSLLRSSLIGFLSMLSTTMVHATADGPDVYQVTGVAADDVLNMRASPSASGDIVGTIPPETDGIMAFDCVGGLSFDAWEQASEAEREAARKTRWCLVGHDRVVGWAAAWFLTEGAGPDSFRGGSRLGDLAGSEWLLKDAAGNPAGAEAWIAFKSDGMLVGNSGCNNFNGSYSGGTGSISLGPIAMTRRACMGSEDETERAFMQVLNSASKVAATHLVLAILDADNVLLATLTRRDAD